MKYDEARHGMARQGGARQGKARQGFFERQMMKTRRMKLNELVIDYTIYPRTDVDAQHIRYLREAYEAGTIFPPIIIDQKSKRIVDGVHRVKMYRIVLQETDTVEVLAKEYADERALLLDAIRLNAGHGRVLTRYDKTHCLLIAEKLHIGDEDLASALSLTMEKVGQLRVERIGQLHIGKSQSQIPLKRTIKHMAGRTLNKRQHEANAKLSGMKQVFYVNQLITLIESDLLNKKDQKLLQRLAYLDELLRKLEPRLLTNIHEKRTKAKKATG